MNGFQEYMTLSEWMEKVVNAAPEEDKRSPLEMLEEWEDSSEITYGYTTFQELLTLFRSRGISFDD